MLKRWFAGAVAAVLFGGIASGVSPALRAQLSSYWSNYAGWTEEARRADPAGFAQYASAKLRQDLEVLERTRRELAAEMGQLSGKLRHQQAFRDQARQLAEEFRAKYQEAIAADAFPIQVRNAAYTREQAKSQVSMILAEMSGHDAATGRLEKVKKQAEGQLEALTLRVNSCESQLAALSVQQEMLRARQLSEEGERLLAQVDDLLDANTRALEDNPVRTVRELLDVSEDGNRQRATDQAVEAFLAGKAPATGQVVEVKRPVTFAGAAQKTDAARSADKVKKDNPPKIEFKPAAPPRQAIQQQQTHVQKRPVKKDKPIFQQF